MNESINFHGEVMSTVVDEVAELSFAHGKVGLRNRLDGQEAIAEFRANLASHTHEITKENTADCGDERVIIALADGTNDREILQRRITRQLFGGIGLSATKAAVEADAAFLKDVTDIWSAYKITSKLLFKLGFEDAGHYGCGASGSVESSVANQIEFPMVVSASGLLVPDDGGNEALLSKNTATRQQRLSDGFYGTWNPANHIDYLKDNFPQNLATLLEDPNDLETHGHNGSGLYATGPRHGYMRDGRAFVVSPSLMEELAGKLGGSAEERRRIRLGFADDTLHVGAGIVAPGFPVFAEAA